MSLKIALIFKWPTKLIILYTKAINMDKAHLTAHILWFLLHTVEEKTDSRKSFSLNLGALFWFFKHNWLF